MGEMAGYSIEARTYLMFKSLVPSLKSVAEREFDAAEELRQSYIRRRFLLRARRIWIEADIQRRLRSPEGMHS